MRKHIQQHINEIIFNSIPLDKGLKRFIRAKFLWLVEKNGSSYACAKVKQLRQAVMGYRADPKRIEHTEQWLAQTGWRKSGWLRKILRYADTQPEYLFNLLKIYCGPNDPVVSVKEAAQNQHAELAKAALVDSRVPGLLKCWLHHICRSKPLSQEQYCLLRYYFSRFSEDECRKYPLARPWVWMYHFIRSHEYDIYQAYVKRWKRNLYVKPSTDETMLADLTKVVNQLALYRPTATQYVDYGRGLSELDRKRSASFEKDVWNFIQMSQYTDLPAELGGNGLSSSSYAFVESLLDPSFVLSFGDDEQVLSFKPDDADILDGTYVGQIHHIPKKGTVDRRSIAAPNRFLQYAMAPADLQLSETLKRLGKGTLGRDCTYDQSRLDAYISNRVSNKSLYAGSVDLHHATDFLPFSWMQCIWDEVFEGRVSEMVAASWQLFVEVARGAWFNEGYLDHWSTGQPLGCLPSFRCLGLTHNLVCEALSFACGYQHSPYCILGDDVVIMSKKLRKEYIKLMTGAHVPLSLQKSYEGNLVEFAGKLFIRNQFPFFNTDQKALTWNSLMDYQWATGVHIPFANLPKKIRNRICHLCVDAGLPRGSGGKAYELGWYYQASARGSHIPVYGMGPEPKLADFCGELASLLNEEAEPDPELEVTCGLQWYGEHPIHYGGYAYTCHHGYYALYRPVTKDWFREKFRPVATDKLLSAAAHAIAIVEHNDQELC